MRDFQFYVVMRQYFLTGQFPPGLTKMVRGEVRRSTPNFRIKQGVLYYVGPKHTYMRQVVLSEEEKRRVLYESHTNVATGTHFGVRSTRDKAVARFYWSTMHRDVVDWVSSCDRCQLNKTIRSLPPALHSIKVKQAWDVLGMDLIGPLPETSREKKFIVAMTDLFTKWVVAEPLRSLSEVDVSDAIVKTLQTFGLVRKILTQQEKSYVDQLNTKIFSALRVQHTVSTTFRPQKNRKVARTTKSIKQALWTYVNEQHDDWDLHLPAVVYDINVAPQVPGKPSPFFMMYNRVPLMPEELNTCPEGDALEVGDADDEIDNVIISECLPQSLLVPRDSSTNTSSEDLLDVKPAGLPDLLQGGKLDRQLVRVAFHHDHYYWSSEPGKLAYEMG